MTLLKKFKEQLMEQLQDLVWKQWTKLGIPGQSTAETSINADPEALVFFTGFLANTDRRLVDNVISWLVTNEHLLFKSRLKKIVSVNHDRTRAALFQIFQKILNVTDDTRWNSLADACGEKTFDSNDSKNNSNFLTFKKDPGNYDEIEARYQNNRIFLRKLFGTSVRAEILNFLLAGGEHSSNGMADVLSISQSSVYKTLEDLRDIEIVFKKEKGRRTAYGIREEKLSLMGLNPELFYDWEGYFKSVVTAWAKIENIGEADTNYKKRSVLNTFRQTFWSSLSNWNQSLLDVEQAVSHDNFMDVNNPAQELLTEINTLPKKAMSKIRTKVSLKS